MISPEPQKPATRKYDVAITVKMPGNARPTTYHLTVDGYSPVDAISQGISDWRKDTDPKDVQVKEIEQVVTP
jgi:hypothetical protein